MLQERGFDARNVRSVLRGNVLELNAHDALMRLEGLSDFTASPQFQQLAMAFKRVRNIGHDVQPPSMITEHEETYPDLRSLLTEPAEQALFDEIEKRRPGIEKRLETADDYRAAFAEAAKFEPAVRRFFDDVMVMVPEIKVRGARLRLLSRLEQLILKLADISEIVAEEKQA
jgi:glycyl-tRNA synthetase beta chain